MKTIFLFLVLVLVSNAYSQTASQYAFTNGYDGSLYDMATGSTQFTFSGGNGNNDDGRTAVTNIGFTFNFCGTNYTQFTINTNALMRLGGTQLSATNYGNTFPYAAPVLSPFGGDHAISSTGKIHYKLFGTAPARYLVVEWLNMEINYSSSAADGTFQVVLYETSNRIEFIYGSMRSGGAGTGGGGNTVRAGIGSGSTSNNFYAVHVNTNATSTSTAQSYTLPGANTTLTNLHNTSQGTRRYYRFQPPCNAVSSAGTISGAQSICNGGNPAAFTSTAASGGSNGFIEYQWESSTTSSSSGFAEISGATAETYDAPSGISTTTYYRRKARRCSVGSTWEQTTSALTVTVAADANAPTATKSPTVAAVCVDRTLTLTSPTYGSQPGQSCGFQYRYSTDNSATWSSISSSIPSFAAVVGTNVIQIRTVGGCSSGCDASDWTSYSWTVVADPVITNQSSTYEITEGQSAQLVSSSTGGTGTLVYRWRYSADNGSFFDVVNGTPTNSTYSFNSNLATDNTLTIGGLGQGTYYYRFRQNNNDVQCSNVGTTITLTVNPQPLPVELLYLKGVAYPLFNIVQWATASEHGSSHFDLQRSVDGDVWTHVATKQAAGNSTENINYSWIDYTERAPLYYYHLIQYDMDGKSKTYGPIVIYGIAEKRVVKLINLLGQEVPAGTTGVLFEVYEDGTLKKILR
jgi:hypothetical protein